MGGIICQVGIFVMMISVLEAKSVSKNICGSKPADIVFVLDASSSIWGPNFEKQLDFVSNVVDMFDLGAEELQTRVGVVAFSDVATVQFYLNEHFRKEELKTAAKSIPYLTGGTNTSGAIRTTREEMFSPEHGARHNVAHVVVVITDGLSEDPRATLREAAEIKTAGIQVFAIGVGFGVDEEELKAIASKPTSQFMFTVDDYEALSSIQDKLTARACKVTQTPATVVQTTVSSTTTPKPKPTSDARVETTPGLESTSLGMIQDGPAIPELPNSKQTCSGKPAEVFFIVDSSSSILIEDFHKQLKFVQSVANLFDFGPTKTRVGMSTFSDTVNPMIDLDRFTSKLDLLNALHDVPYLSGGTNTGGALQDMRERGMSTEVVRREVAHVAIVLTDGQSRDPKKTEEQARLAKKNGLYLFAIGIGEDVDMTELQAIASRPSKKFVFRVDNYDALESIKDVLAIRTCEVPVEEIPSDIAVCPSTPTDVMFVYDSGKLGVQKTAQISSLITNTINQVRMSKGAFQFGVLADTCPSDNRLRVALTTDRSLIVDGVTARKRRDLSTLLYDLRTEAFTEENGGRKQAKKTAILFLDDALGDFDATVKEAKRARFYGIDIFVVGVGQRVEAKHVEALSSVPMSDFYHHFSSYESLASGKYELLQKICNAEKEISY